MSNLLKQAQEFIEQDNFQEAIAILKAENDQNIEPDYYWLYGLALFGQSFEEQAQDIWLEGLLSQEYSDDAIQSLIKQLESYVKRQSNKPANVSIEKIYQISGIIAELSEDYYQTQYLPHLAPYLEIAKKEALSLAISKKELEAKKIYEILVFFFFDNAELFHQLGTLYFHLKDYENSINFEIKAIELNPEEGMYYYGLGLIYEKLENYQQAINAYSKALEKDQKHADTYSTLGNILTNLNQIEAAEKIYKEAIDNEINHFGIYLNYGNLLLAQDKNLEAIELYKKAIPLFHDYPDIYHNLAIAWRKIGDLSEAEVNLGRALFYEGKDDDAFKVFEKCRTLYRIDDWDYWNEISIYYMISNKYETLLGKVEQGVQKFPDSIRQRVYVIACLMRFYRHDEARTFALSCINYFSQEPEKQFIFKLLHHSIIPVIYHSQEEILVTRQRYDDELQSLLSEIHLISEVAKPYIMFALEIRGSHYLHFHGCNDLQFQCLYGQLATYFIQSYFPEFTKSLKLSKVTNRKIRVGYVCVRSQGLGQLFVDWIKLRNINLFEVFFYDLGQDISAKTEKFSIFSDHYCHCPWNIEQVAERIHQDKLDILVFLDTVIESKLHTLSFFRFAPIQCATWGHPVTTGSPQIDYFLGSDAMEPTNAQDHYSEKLIRLPNLGVYLHPIDVSMLAPKLIMSKKDFNLEETDIVYISCQMLSKYLPQHDYLYPEIIRQVPNAKILFFNAYESDAITDIFRERLAKEFQSHQLNFDNYCLFSPRLAYEKYINILLLADVFLDTLGWSGGITTFDVIACGLPMVTMPGELMRGRQTYGMLKTMEIEEMIIYSEIDYIQLAVKLGNDRQFQQRMRQQICKQRHKLYYDQSCIEALEKFYCDVVNVSLVEQLNELSH
jgi:predicted O-linked N-acetylglucosamine transferase (SPINDLY family)